MRIKKIRIVTQEYLDELNELLENEIKHRNNVALLERKTKDKFKKYQDETEKQLKILKSKNDRLIETKECLEQKLEKVKDNFFSKSQSQTKRINDLTIKNKELSGRLGGKQRYINKLENEKKELVNIIEKLDRKRRFLEKKVLPPTMDKLVSYTERKKTKSNG